MSLFSVEMLLLRLVLGLVLGLVLADRFELAVWLALIALLALIFRLALIALLPLFLGLPLADWLALARGIGMFFLRLFAGFARVFGGFNGCVLRVAWRLL